MRPVHPSAAPTPVRIGAQLRSSRLAQGITLAQLAQATGLTRGFLSRIERDETMPSVPTLVQICQALSLPLGELFAEPDIQRVALTEAPRINMGGTGADERLVTPRSEDRVQLIRSSLAPGASGGEELYTVNCAVESLHLVSGSLELAFPDRWMRLDAGDTLTFPGRTPHSWRAGASGAEAVWVLVPAAWSGSS
ncbi:helix-turn-helix domain-containing protein [Leucobacter massiliensis]|uniref:XRE family transcriptional regulator n=1 Tax=Leucobacter massiliensis TaxID=1686285 RepID=A0A2S9QLX2_9MICO|nr:helix-turn-helix domain-containing protein [Leucobacter massiliensis]PRI10586.1 XRE family transcriptional regulator [Leucobacter massiliensis]